MKDKVVAVLERIRKNLQSHGGDVELVDVDESSGEVKVRLQGACVGCPLSQLTLQMSIERELKKEIPEVKKVISV